MSGSGVSFPPSNESKGVSCFSAAKTKIKNFATDEKTQIVFLIVLVALLGISILMTLNGGCVLLKRLANIDLFGAGAKYDLFRNMSTLGGAILMGGSALGIAVFSTLVHFQRKSWNLS